MTFEIGDVVSLKGLDGFHEVIGVIHDDERIFLSIEKREPAWSEVEFRFSDVDAQYRRIGT